jgi:hypothetical protein
MLFSSTDNINGIQMSLLCNMSNLMDLMKRFAIQTEKENDKPKDFPEWFILDKDYTSDVNGFQMSLLFNMSKYVYGGQMGFINVVEAEMGGMQLGLFNLMDEDSVTAGWQLAVIVNGIGKEGYGLQTAVLSNSVNGYFAGLQLALANSVQSELQGVQIGLQNETETLEGVQIGLYNESINASGIQIGLLNHIENAWIPYFPIINFAF